MKGFDQEDLNNVSAQNVRCLQLWTHEQGVRKYVGIIRMLAEYCFFHWGRRCPDKNCREQTTFYAVVLSAFGQEGNIFNICCNTDGFCRLSEGYHHRCSFSRFFHRLLNLPKFGTLGECRLGSYLSSRKNMILYSKGICRLWRWNLNDFFFKLTRLMFLTRKNK